VGCRICGLGIRELTGDQIDAFYCQPGLQGAYEKGGVEGQSGWFRRNHLVPVPSLN
jgi:hypothetical protein